VVALVLIVAGLHRTDRRRGRAARALVLIVAGVVARLPTCQPVAIFKRGWGAGGVE
jgi:hypothetical protein